MRDLTKKLYEKLGLDDWDTCADAAAIFVKDGGKIFKLTVSISTEAEFSKAWGYLDPETEKYLEDEWNEELRAHKKGAV